MKRDMNIARAILLAIEEIEAARPGFIDVAVDGATDEQVSYHVKILAQAGLVEAVELTSSSGFCWKPQGLTWIGHEFLDAARDESGWKKVVSELTQNGVGFSLEIAKTLLLEEAKRRLGVA